MRERREKNGETWIKSDWYCMDCGQRDVWQRENEGADYYVGYSATCFGCDSYMEGLGKVRDVEPERVYWWDTQDA